MRLLTLSLRVGTTSCDWASTSGFTYCSRRTTREFPPRCRGFRTTTSTTIGADSFEIVPLYFQLDGTFPHHEANPMDPANLFDLRAARQAWPESKRATWQTADDILALLSSPNQPEADPLPDHLSARSLVGVSLPVHFSCPQPVDDAVDAPGEVAAVGGERQVEHLGRAFLGGRGA